MNATELYFHISGIAATACGLFLILLSFKYNDKNAVVQVSRARRLRLSALGVGCLLKSAAYFMCFTGSARWWPTRCMGELVLMLSLFSMIAARAWSLVRHDCPKKQITEGTIL